MESIFKNKQKTGSEVCVLSAVFEDLEKEILQSGENKVVFWGASLFLKDFLSGQPIFKNVIGIIDKNPEKQGADFCGYKIFSPESLNSLKPDKVLFTIRNNNTEIFEAVKNEFLQKHPEIELSNAVQLAKHYCPYCDKELFFEDCGTPARLSVKCPVCKSLERHRFLYYIYKKIIEENKRRKIKLLHKKKKKCIYDLLIKQPNIEYTTIDLCPDIYPFADNCLKMNILDMEFEDNSFDYIFSNHVIEHIDDEAGFFRECLRVLKPEGKLVLTAPYDTGLETTFEDPSIITKEERLKYYGHKDHVRKYGKDMFDRFSKYGLVSVIGADFLSEEEKLKMNLGKIESAAVITKFPES